MDIIKKLHFPEHLKLKKNSFIYLLAQRALTCQSNTVNEWKNCNLKIALKVYCSSHYSFLLHCQMLLLGVGCSLNMD